MYAECAAEPGRFTGDPDVATIRAFRVVRGAVTFTNVESRRAWRFAERWALQGAVFGDGTVLLTMDARGRGQGLDRAASSGAGLRLIPTFLAAIALRIGAGRLFAPGKWWFVQAAFAQYL